MVWNGWIFGWQCCWKCHLHFKTFWFVIICVEWAHAIYGSVKRFLWSLFQWEMWVHSWDEPSQPWRMKLPKNEMPSVCCLHQICIQRLSEQWSMASYVGQCIKGWTHTLKEYVTIDYRRIAKRYLQWFSFSAEKWRRDGTSFLIFVNFRGCVGVSIPRKKRWIRFCIFFGGVSPCSGSVRFFFWGGMLN